MRYLRTALKFLGAILIYAVAVAAFFISVVPAIDICDRYKWLIEKPSGTLWDGPDELPHAMLIMLAMLGLFYLVQVVLWGVTGRVIRLRYRLGLDVLFGLSYALVVCLAFDDFRWPALGVIFFFAALPPVLTDLLMCVYVRGVDPAAVTGRRPAPPLPPPGPRAVLAGPFPQPIRPAPRSDE